MRRLLVVFTSATLASYCTERICCDTTSRAALKSTLRQVSPSTSPRRIPVLAAMKIGTYHSLSSMLARNVRNSSADHTVISLEPRTRWIVRRVLGGCG